VFLGLLASHIAQGRDVSPNRGQTYAPVVFEKHPSALNIDRKAFAAAMERLLTSNRIQVEPVGPPSRRYKRLVIVSERFV
jgi:hypothetical protein